MAFVNQRVPIEERNTEYNVIGWPNKVKIGMFWTADYEKNVKLFKFHTSRDFPNEPYFVLIWKGYIISVQLTKNRPGNNTIEWSNPRLILPEEIKGRKNEVLADLREAMKVFGFFGEPESFLKSTKKENTVILF